MCSDLDHTVLPVNYTMPAFAPQPQSITALWLYSFYHPTEGRRLVTTDMMKTCFNAVHSRQMNKCKKCTMSLFHSTKADGLPCATSVSYG